MATKNIQLTNPADDNLMPRTKTEVISIDIIHNNVYKGFVAGKCWLPAGLSTTSHFSAHTDLIEVKQGDVIIVENYRTYASATGGGPFCAIYPTNEGTGGTRYNCNDVLVPDPSVSLKYTFTVPQDGWIGINIGVETQAYITACRIIHQQVEEGNLKDKIDELDGGVKRIEDSLYQSVDGKQVDVIIFMGQSNMGGRGIVTDTHPEDAPSVLDGAGYEFRAITDPTQLYPITKTLGVDENVSSGINDTVPKTGGCVPAFVNAYFLATKTPVIAVSASEGNTRSSVWMAGTARLNDAISRLESCVTWLTANGYDIAHRYMVWCQGEADADAGIDAASYSTNFANMFAAMQSHGIEKCFMIQIGEYNGSTSGLAEAYQLIQQAQVDICDTTPNVVMVSDSFRLFKARGLMKDQFHYYQDGYNIVGLQAGHNAGLNRDISGELDSKVDKEEGKSLIDNEYAEGVHYVENPEFVYLKADADDAIIEGVKSNGQKYLPMPSNQDDILQRQIDSVNEVIDKFDTKSNILPMFPQDGSIVFIAHRGVTLGGIDNQYECFYQAHRFGFKYIEFDIQPTSDGKFILAHNYTANLYYTYKDGSAIDDSVRIGDLTLDYILNNFIVKTSNEKMAHAPMDFETSLKLCRRWGLIPYIDIKGDIPSGTVTTKELDYIVNLATKYLGKCNFVCTTNRASWLDYIRTLGEEYALSYYGGDGIAGTNVYTNKSRLTPRTTGVNYYGTAQAKLDAFIAYNEYAKSGNTEMDCDMKDPIIFNQALDLGCRVFFCYNDPPLFTDNEISSEYGWDKFNYTGQLENDILNLDTSQYISKTVDIDSSYGAICIYLRFKGSIKINVNGNSKTVTYEDWNEWCFSYMMSKGETGEKTVLITALEPSSIYYLKVCYKNA